MGKRSAWSNYTTVSLLFPTVLVTVLGSAYPYFLVTTSSSLMPSLFNAVQL